jgi:hypothetical protein
VIWRLACIILFIINFQAKIVVGNEDKTTKYLNLDLFVVKHFFIATSLTCIFCTRADIDMHFVHGGRFG